MKRLVLPLLGALALTRPSFATDLPPEYESVGWIESSGTQWINTEFTPLCTDRVETKIRFLALEASNYAVFCARGANNAGTFTCLRINGWQGFRFDRNGGTGDGGSSKVLPVLETDYSISMDANAQTWQITRNGGTNNGSCGTPGDFTVGSPFSLFAAHSGTLEDASMSMKSSMRLYYFRVYGSDDTLKAALQPCRRKSDNKPGLYDLINDKFLTNAGTGEFDAPLIAVPSGYTLLKWIRSSGTQYINTGYTPMSTDKFTVRFRILNPTTDTSVWQALYCARGSGSGAQQKTLTCQLNKKSLRFDYYDATRGWSGALEGGVDYLLEADGNTQTNRIDGVVLEKVGRVECEPFSAGSTLHLLSNQTGGSCGSYKLYEFTVTDRDGLLQCQCVPCMRDSDDAVGLYDLVRQQFLENAGTGSFAAGGLGLMMIFR